MSPPGIHACHGPRKPVDQVVAIRERIIAEYSPGRVQVDLNPEIVQAPNEGRQGLAMAPGVLNKRARQYSTVLGQPT